MPNPWFRLYAEFSKDPKIQSLDETLQRRFVMLLCLKCNDELNKLTDEELAFALHISIEQLEETGEIFKKKGFIDGTWEISNWNKRQFISDISTERSRLYRKRQKTKKICNGKEPLQKRNGNVSATPPDTDTDTDTDIKILIAGTIILSDGSEYKIEQSFIDNIKKSYPDVDIKKQIKLMTAWCISNPKKRKTKIGAKRFINNWFSSAQEKAEEKRKENNDPKYEYAN